MKPLLKSNNSILEYRELHRNRYVLTRRANYRRLSFLLPCVLYNGTDGISNEGGDISPGNMDGGEFTIGVKL